MKVKKVHLHHRARRILDALERQNISTSVDIDQIQTELFAAPTVTTAEVHAWLRAIPQIDPASPRAAYYIQHYDVAGKIAKAKAAGRFYAEIEAAGIYIDR